MLPDVLQHVAMRPFAPNFVLSEVPGTYIGSQLPLHGSVTIRVALSNISAEIIDDGNWFLRSVAELPRGSVLSGNELFHRTAPGSLIKETATGTIKPDFESWEAREVVNNGSSSHVDQTGSTNVYRFSVGQLIVHGDAIGREAVAVRQVFSRADWAANAMFHNRPMLIRALVDKPSTLSSQIIGITLDWLPDNLERAAIWNTLSFISGNTVRQIADEYYDVDGNIIRTEYRIGSDFNDRRRAPFNRFEARLPGDGVQQLCEGFYRLLRSEYPIEVVLAHLFESSRRAIDIEAQQLVLGVHTAIEAWNRSFGIEYWIDDNIWRRYQKLIRKSCIPEDVYEDLGEEMKANLRASFAHSHRTTTAWREAALFKALDIDVSDKSSRRVLALRNELLHNGYFLRRWSNLSHDERQMRVQDIERLRRILLLIIFRLSSYEGSFVNPVTFQAESIKRCSLPDAIS